MYTVVSGEIVNVYVAPGASVPGAGLMLKLGALIDRDTGSPPVLVTDIDVPVPEPSTTVKVDDDGEMLSPYDGISTIKNTSHVVLALSPLIGNVEL